MLCDHSLRNRILSACGILALLGAPLPAQIPILPPVPVAPTPPGPATEDQLFLNDAWRFSLQECDMGALALQKSSNDSVRQYARRMITQHALLQAQLVRLARQVHVTAPRDTGDDAELPRLVALQGAAFDRAYVNVSLSHHAAAIASLQNLAGARIAPPGVRLNPLADWAARTLPQLNDESSAAQSLARDLSGVATSDAPPPP